MRTAVFIGLTIIASSISHIPDGKAGLIALLTILFIFMDVIDFINKIRK